MIKPSERRFRVPVRLYDLDWNKDKADMHFEDSGERIIPDYIIGYARIDISDIRYWMDTASMFIDFETIKSNGPTSTVIVLKDGEEIICSWKREKFESEYDKYIESLTNEVNSVGTKVLSAENITDEVAKALEKVLKDYKKLKKDGQQTAKEVL